MRSMLLKHVENLSKINIFPL